MIQSFAKLLFQPDSDALRFLPEGPYPNGPNRFSWVAIQHRATATTGSLNIYDLSTGVNRSYPLPGRPGFAFPTDRGNFVIGCERSVGIFSPSDGSWEPLVDGIDASIENTIVNDGITWDGNLIFGTKDLEFKTKKAGLYLWRGRDRKLFQLRDDQICSNGKCVLPVGEKTIDLLDIDSPTRKVVAYRIDLERGTASEPRTVVDLQHELGVPDGMTLSPDASRLIISLYNPDPAPFGRTIGVSLDSGRVEEEWQTLGSPQATCPQWVEYQGKAMLVITTAIEHMPAGRRAESPNAGSLFAVETDQPWSKEIFGRLTPLFVE